MSVSDANGLPPGRTDDAVSDREQSDVPMVPSPSSNGRQVEVAGAETVDIRAAASCDSTEQVRYTEDLSRGEDERSSQDRAPSSAPPTPAYSVTTNLVNKGKGKGPQRQWSVQMKMELVSRGESVWGVSDHAVLMGVWINVYHHCAL